LVLLIAAVAAPLVVAYVVACFRDPLRFALPPYAALMPFSSLLAVGSGPFGSLSSMLGMLLGISVLAQLVTTRRGAPRLPLAVPVWLAFLAVCSFSLMWSIAPSVTLSSVAVLASLVLLFVALVLTRFDAETLRRFETAVVVGGVLVVCYGLFQLVFTGLPAPDGRSARFGNDLLGANNQASSLLLPLAIAAARAMTGPARSRLANAGTAALLLFGILMTGSRGGLLATLVVLGGVVLLGAGTRAVKGILLAVAVVVLTAVFVIQPGGVGQRQLTDSSSSGRTDIWTVGLHSCPLYCLRGAGWGTFPTVYQQQLPSTPQAKFLARGVAYQPHNIFILAVVESGVLGLLLMLAGLGIAVVGALRLPQRWRGPPAGALLGTIASAFFLSNLEYKFFWAVLVYVTVSAQLPGRATDVPATTNAVVPASAVGGSRR
jgi:O-antigen ligase